MATASVVRATPASSGLYDVLDLILDKGLVVDAYVRVSVIGIEILTIDLRVVIASVDTYLRFAEAVDRLHLQDQGGADLTDLTGGNGSRSRALNRGDDDESGGIRGALGRVRDKVGSSKDDDDRDDRDDKGEQKERSADEG